MSTQEIPECKPPNRLSIPRWMALILALFAWLVAIPLVHGGIPWVISTCMARYGWSEGQPGNWNRFGLFLIAIAGALLFWILLIGITQTPKRVELRLTPSFLMTRGPYTFTRNPMYVAELVLWLGWAVFFGSIGILIGFVVFCLVVNRIILPREERTLETAFGHLYLQYKNTVPRWFVIAQRLR